MAKKKSNKAAARRAEYAAEHFLVSLGCIITRRMIRTRFNKVDFFGADVVGKNYTGRHFYAQATSSEHEQALKARQSKLELIPWHPSDIVFVVWLKSEIKGRSKEWYFQVYEYIFNDEERVRSHWSLSTVDVPKEWMKPLESE